MHLTLESLHQVKNTCSEIQGLEGLMDAENRMAVNEQLIALQDAVNQSITTIDTLDRMKGSLEACGYSEEWFDNVCSMGFKDLVEIDMPKFFDNKINRQQVCMEGFMDTIKAWLKKAWELLKRFLGWLRDKLSWLVKQLGISNHTCLQGVKKAMDNIDKKLDEYLAKKSGVDLNNWYELSSVPTHLRNINILLSIVGDVLFLDKDINGSAPIPTSDDEMKKALHDKLVAELYAKGLHSSKSSRALEDGFEVVLEHGNNQIVKFANQVSNNWPEKIKLEIRSRENIEGLKKLLIMDLPTQINAIIQIATICDRDIKEAITIKETEINQVLTSVNPDQAQVAKDRKFIMQANIASKIVVDAIAYIHRVNQLNIYDASLITKLSQTIDQIVK